MHSTVPKIRKFEIEFWLHFVASELVADASDATKPDMNVVALVSKIKFVVGIN